MKHFEKKSRLIFTIVIIVIITLLICIILLHTSFIPSTVSSNNIKLEYGVKDKTAFLIVSPKKNGELHFTGNSSILKNKFEEKIGTESHIKIISISKTSKMDNASKWYAPLTDESIYRWSIEFKDKIIVIQNGKLIDEKFK